MEHLFAHLLREILCQGCGRSLYEEKAQVTVDTHGDASTEMAIATKCSANGEIYILKLTEAFR